MKGANMKDIYTSALKLYRDSRKARADHVEELQRTLANAEQAVMDAEREMAGAVEAGNMAAFKTAQASKVDAEGTAAFSEQSLKYLAGEPVIDPEEAGRILDALHEALRKEEAAGMETFKKNLSGLLEGMLPHFRRHYELSHAIGCINDGVTTYSEADYLRAARSILTNQVCYLLDNGSFQTKTKLQDRINTQREEVNEGWKP